VKQVPDWGPTNTVRHRTAVSPSATRRPGFAHP